MEKAYDPVKAAFRRFKPDYENEIEVFHLKTKLNFLHLANIICCAMQKGGVIAMGRSRHLLLLPYFKNEENRVAKRRKITSIKVGCKANLKIKCFNNDSFEVAYNWRHSNHTPKNIAELSGSRLPEATKQ
ncbi:hypothetical protein [Parasitella parasitica]|uniref:FAR1 domain-containing protein n=1 Tax=Parasitella parasitica TaxID=35722 RepID=A0A0B7NCW8_9FUNG|nr:hypothetical protein [Parasitella parasitica]